MNSPAAAPVVSPVVPLEARACEPNDLLKAFAAVPPLPARFSPPHLSLYLYHDHDGRGRPLLAYADHYDNDGHGREFVVLLTRCVSNTSLHRKALHVRRDLRAPDLVPGVWYETKQTEQGTEYTPVVNKR